MVVCKPKRDNNPNNVPIGDIIRYEAGEMGEEETIDMFQKLINSGMAWTLQGHYGRMATDLINAGLCTRPKKE